MFNITLTTPTHGTTAVLDVLGYPCDTYSWLCTCGGVKIGSWPVNSAAAKFDIAFPSGSQGLAYSVLIWCDEDGLGTYKEFTGIVA